MKPEPLYGPDKQTVVGWRCSECARVALVTGFIATPDEAQEAARSIVERCCDRRCQKCGERIEPQNSAYVHCRPCQEAVWAEREREKRDKAERVPLERYAETYVFLGDEDFPCADELDDCGLEMEDGTRWGWATKPIHLSLDADSILEQALDEHHEDAVEGVNIESLQERLDAWCKENPVTSWEPDFKRIVVLAPPEGGWKDKTE